MEAPYTGTEYLIPDHLGSSRLAINGQGQVVRRYDFLPFGEELKAGLGGRGADYEPSTYTYPTTPDDVTRKFTGKDRDWETGLDFFGARYMSSAQGRFTSPDSLFADQRPGFPESWNLYSYVRNNALVSVDRDGRAQCEAQAGGSTNAWLAYKGVDSSITSSDNSLTPGAVISSDSRYALFVGPSGNGRIDRTGVDKTVGPEFDAVAGGAQLAGTGILGALRFALRAASEKLGLEVTADLGIAMSRAAIDGALASDARVLHAGRHLVENGLLDEGSNAAIAAGTRTIRLFSGWGRARARFPVRLFVGNAGGQLVGVAIADRAVGSVAKGAIVTIKVRSH